MKCHNCNKKATVHLTEIVDGKVMEMHLCEECARAQSQHMEQQFGLADLLAGLTDFGKQIPATAKEELKCPTCGLTYDEFRKLGRFGCAQCYVAFHSQLRTLLKKIHGSNSHLGKHPEHVSPLVIDEVPSSGAVTDPGEEALDHLRLRLQKAIMEEDFEQAAVLRDKIRKIEQGE